MWFFRKLRPQQLDREARTLGRSLVKTDNEDGDDYDNEDDYDDDYDFSDMDCSNMTFTPIFRYFINSVFDICSWVISLLVTIFFYKILKKLLNVNWLK